MAFGEYSKSDTQVLNGCSGLKRRERLWKAAPGSKLDRSVARRFFRSRRCCASRVRSRGSHNKQEILLTNCAASSWSNTPQAATRVVVRELANPPQQRTSALVSTCGIFLNQTRNPTRAATYIFFRPCTV